MHLGELPPTCHLRDLQARRRTIKLALSILCSFGKARDVPWFGPVFSR